MKRWQKAVLGLAGFLVLLVCFTVFVLPGIVRSQAIRRIETATGRTISIKKVSLNPFTWTAEVRGVRLAEKGGGATFVSFSSVRVSISPKSIWRAAPIVSEARVVSPYLHIVRTAPHTYNFSDLMEEKGPKKENAGKPARFSLNNIVIEKGAVDFVDRALPKEKSHTVRQIALSVPFISSIPYLADKYVLPRFSAVVNGAPLRIEGRLKPYARSMETSITIDLHNLDLPFYFAYVPGPVPVLLDSGTLAVKLGVAYRVAREGKSELDITGTARLADLSLRDRTGAPLGALKQGDVAISRAEVMSREFSLSSVAATGVVAHLSRDGKGVWSYTRLMGPEQQPEQQKPLVSIAETHLKNGEFHFSDAVPKGGFTSVLRDITLDMTGFSTGEGKKASYAISFATTRNERGSFKGDFSVTPLAAAIAAELNGIVLEAYYPYLAAFLTVPVSGRLDATADVSMTPADGVVMDKGGLRLRDISAPFGKEEGVKLRLAEVKGASVKLKEMTAEAASVSFTGGAIRFSRDQAGRLSPLNLLREQGNGSPKKETAKGTGKKGSAPAFHYLIKSVAGSGLAVTFTDGTKEESPEFGISNLSFSAANITGPKLSPIPFRIAAVYGKGGSVKASGTVTPEPFKARGECALRQIPIKDFDPYFPEGLNIVVADGAIDARTSFNLAQGKNGLAGDFKGELGVRNVYCLDAADNEDLLKWESLQLDNISGNLNPFAISVKDVSLSKFFAKVVVNKDGTLNLQGLYTPEKKEGSADKVAAAPAPPPGQPAVPPARNIRIDAVTLQDGVLAFTDHHMSPEYATTMYNLGGRVSGLSSEEGKFADVDLRGNLENQSPLSITGQINPLRDDLFLDLKVSFSDIELSPVTPYSGTFLGYTVDKGKLFLDLKYRIEKKNLLSENKVFLDQFTLGKKVASDRATNLPVRLAIALLKDRKGEIHLDLPVTGRTDDPKFSVFGVVLQMLKNLLVKAATAPFALIQGLFGGKDDFSGVHFAYGTARVTDPEREKLRKLAQVLRDRPALKLEVAGFVDRERDAEGYRDELLLKKMKAEKFLVLAKEKKELAGQSPETMTVQPEEQSLYLKAVYKKEKFPKPRNMLGLAKDLPDTEMKKLILANTVVGDEQLKGLARERAAAVRNTLMAEGKLPPERIFEKSGDIYKAPAKEGETGSRVEFGVAVE